MMSKFKNHKLKVSDLLNLIPENLLSHLSETTSVDHYTKVLHGRKLFYLLLYGIIENEKMSQRTLEDTFNDSVFKFLFNLPSKESISRSSISERLSKINPDYFKEIYECIYANFSKYYSLTERKDYNLIRVDSSIVSDVTGKIIQGIDQNNNRKAVKYSVAFDGILPCGIETFTQNTYSNEDMALPEVITKHIKKESNHQNIYVFDRGIQSTRTLSSFEEKEQITFIGRSKENRKYIQLEVFQEDKGNIVKDCKVQLYTGIPKISKKGTKYYKEELVQTPFRLLIWKTQEDKEFWFVTNNFDLSAEEIAENYRKRWDIEVFFRFLKQELNFSHLVSLSPNGIQVILYMTMIVAMLILMYKKANDIGYKTAKRRFKQEIRDLAIALIIIESGGNPNKFFSS